MSSNFERKLSLLGGRTLAYEEAGTTSSKIVVLYLHGAFTVGEASQPSSVLLRKGVHYVAPTLPGWGNTSSPPPSTSYVDCLTTDMTALLDHLYPEDNHDITLYVAGGSFGTAPAQILYGASYEKFPYGRRIAGLLLLGAMSPFYYHRDYAKYMSWSNYIMAGPPALILPFNIIPRLVKLMLKRKLSSVAGAEAFLQETLFGKMKEDERKDFAEWRDAHRLKDGDTEHRLAKNVARSVATSWNGVMLMSAVLHSDWGFRPDALDAEHSRPSVLLASSKDDVMAPEAYAKYLAACYKNARIKSVGGGHLSVLYHLDEIWTEFLATVADS
ncbi:Alpha/Beta hydrolase protein [Hygrophoropsis aurantiaca]|uniref:Alpha/Beta hydrolase protein n=1 Tax=Hygrophoropsis aurantiaca TaxID=72124 RepID=A0ACB8AS73_9AGAM|nr:Alpha/Beta hydrolase protein [Hygrophoropsis aurantiaca]